MHAFTSSAFITTSMAEALLGRKRVEELQERVKINDTILDVIGYTPLVRLNRIAKDMPCEFLGKCEFLNAGGSVKDRIGRRMVLDAEAIGRIKAGDVLIEPTSGNTGIGLCLAAAVRDYRVIITLPEKMSKEKENTMLALGAEIIRTPTEAAWDSPESHIGVANRLQREIPNAHVLDQYTNPSNPDVHYDDTADEIIWACDGKLDALVIGAGTGGTITGVAKKIKEKIPSCKIVGVDPHGSLLADPEHDPVHTYLVEGIGYDFVPDVLDRSQVDMWIKTGDAEAFLMARRLIQEEGLLCGGSSGSAMVAALQTAKILGLKEGDRCVVILPDSIRNYMTKFIDDKWMVANGFMEEKDAKRATYLHKLREFRVDDLHGLPRPPVTLGQKSSCEQAIQILRDRGIDQIPVVNEMNVVVGMITEKSVMTHLVGTGSRNDPVSNVMEKQFKVVQGYTPLDVVLRYLEGENCVVVVEDSKPHPSIKTLVTRIDLLNHLSKAPLTNKGDGNTTNKSSF